MCDVIESFRKSEYVHLEIGLFCKNNVLLLKFKVLGVLK